MCTADHYPPSCPSPLPCSAGLLADLSSQSQYCQQQGSGSGASRLAFCLDSHTGAGCSASEAAVGERASGRRQYIGGWPLPDHAGQLAVMLCVVWLASVCSPPSTNQCTLLLLSCRLSRQQHAGGLFLHQPPLTKQRMLSCVCCRLSRQQRAGGRSVPAPAPPACAHSATGRSCLLGPLCQSGV